MSVIRKKGMGTSNSNSGKGTVYLPQIECANTLRLQKIGNTTPRGAESESSVALSREDRIVAKMAALYDDRKAFYLSEVRRLGARMDCAEETFHEDWYAERNRPFLRSRVRIFTAEVDREIASETFKTPYLRKTGPSPIAPAKGTEVRSETFKGDAASSSARTTKPELKKPDESLQKPALKSGGNRSVEPEGPVRVSMAGPMEEPRAETHASESRPCIEGLPVKEEGDQLPKPDFYVRHYAPCEIHAATMAERFGKETGLEEVPVPPLKGSVTLSPLPEQGITDEIRKRRREELWSFANAETRMLLTSDMVIDASFRSIRKFERALADYAIRVFGRDHLGGWSTSHLYLRRVIRGNSVVQGQERGRFTSEGRIVGKWRKRSRRRFPFGFQEPGYTLHVASREQAWGVRRDYSQQEKPPSPRKDYLPQEAPLGPFSDWG